MIDLQSIANDVKPKILSAGEMIVQDWEQHHFSAHLKNERDVVTDTDEKVEEYLRQELYKILPQAGFIVEEGKTEMNSEFNWTIDPIDGTKFFASGAPLFYTQVSLLRNGEPELSFVYQPVSKHLFSAIKGKGAYLNDVKIAPSTLENLDSAIIEFDLGNLKNPENKWKFEVIEKICSKIYRPRFSSGYLSLYLVTGAVDAVVNTDITQPYSIKNSVDLLPHDLILSEAGFIKQSVKYGEKTILLHSSQQLLDQLISLLS